MLDGEWDVRPLPGVRKRIVGSRGQTIVVGLVRLPFDVRGLELRYRGPLAGVVDVLEADGDGYRGRATLFGHTFGKFRMVRRAT